eukprot:Opistho-1_new@59427
MSQPTKLFVARLPYAVCRDTLKTYFSKFGNVRDSIVVTDRITGRSKGFGFVEFEDKDAFDKALNTQHQMDGREIAVQPATVRPPRRDFGGRQDYGGPRPPSSGPAEDAF